MAEVQWIKIYIDMFDKRKIKKLRRLPAGNELLLIWIMLLATAGKCNAGGHIFITENVPFTEEDLADELGFEVSTIKLALKAFEELDMITYTNDGFIDVIGWEEYQNTDRLAEIREYNRIAQQKSRAKKKLLEGVNDNVNDMSMTSQRCHETEEEEEKDKEKEFHSFVLSETNEDDYVAEKVSESGLEGDDAEAYKAEIKERLKLKYIGGTLGENIIRMSDEQFDYLCDNYGIDEIEYYFGIIKDCERSGKRYKKKTHFQAFQEMAKADRRVKT